MRGPELLKKWRMKKKLSQAECCELVGVEQATWSDWEAGKKQPRIEHAITIAQVSKDAVPIVAWARERAA